MAGEGNALKQPKPSRNRGRFNSRRSQSWHSSPNQRSAGSLFSGRDQESQPRLHVVKQPSPSTDNTGDDSTAKRLRQAEDQSFNRPNATDSVKNENSQRDFYRPEDYDSRIKNANSKKTKNKKQGPFIQRAKGKIAGGIAGVGIGGFLLIGGITASGPIQFLHLAELIGEITDTIYDAVLGGRTLRLLSKSGVSSTIQNSRLNIVDRFWANNYEGKLAKSGITIQSDNVGRFESFDIDTKMADTSDLGRFTGSNGTGTVRGHPNIPDGTKISSLGDGKFKLSIPDGGTPKTNAKWFKSTFRGISNMSPNVPRAGPITTRVLGHKNLMTGFHPLQKIEAKVIGAGIERIEKFVMKRTAKKLAKQGVAEELAERVARRVATRIGKTVLKTAVKAVPVIGWIFTVVDFGITLALKRAASAAAMSMTLGVSMATSMTLLSIGSQIKSGFAEFGSPANTLSMLFGPPTANAADEEGEEFSVGVPMDLLELAAEQYLYREIPAVDLLGDDYDPGQPTFETAGMFDRDNEGNFINSVDDFAEQINGSVRDTTNNFMSSDANMSTVQSSIWQNSLIQGEMDGNWTGFEGDIPPELLGISRRSEDDEVQWAKDIAASAVEAIGIGVSWDTFDGSTPFTGDDLPPRMTGATIMYGARVTANEKMRAIGGKGLDDNTCRAIEQERVAILNEEFNRRPWYAKIFDPTTYRSAVSTLARNSGWYENDGSVFDRMKNVAQTLFRAPQLIASNINQVATASADGFDYNLGCVGFEDEEVDNLPTMDESWPIIEDILERDSSITLNDIGITIDSQGMVAPMANGGDYENKSTNTYSYQDTKPGDFKFGDYEEDEIAAIRGFILDYSLKVPSAGIAYDESEEAEAAIAASGFSQTQVEDALNDTFNKLIGSFFGNSSSGGGGAGAGNITPGKLNWPAECHRITQYFNSGHTGVDIACDSRELSWDSKVFAAEAGTVVTAQYSSTAGNYITINHEALGISTVYMHANRLHVSVGDTVVRGQHIMDMGNTGNVSPRPTPAEPKAGTHLHFMVYPGFNRSGSPQDALDGWISR